MAARTRSNPLALAVLCLLHERPMHPYEMSSTLRERRKEESIKLNYGSLYSVVDSLERRGLVNQRETVREGRRPQRTVYAITEAGIAEMTDWLTDLLARPVKEYTNFEAALSLIAGLPPEDVLRLLDERLTALRKRRDDYDAAIAGAPRDFPRLFLIEAEFQYDLLRTEIAFVEKLTAEVRSGEFGGLAMWRRMHELRRAGTPPERINDLITNEFREELSWLSELGNNTEQR